MISIVVPAYNEEDRIEPFLDDLFESCKDLNREIIFVNDGSTDNTLKIIKDVSKGKKKTEIISYKKNKGKGAAVRKGVLASNGDKIVFIDADGSIHPRQIKKMGELLDNYEVVVGSRAHKKSDVTQPGLRKLTGICFNTYANILFNIRVDDTLCGFKGFKADVGKNLFGKLKSSGWTFDVELFYLIRKKGYSMYEMPIKWVHKEKSKMNILDPVKMAYELLSLRLKI